MSEYYDTIPGPDLDVDGVIIPTFLVRKEADDKSGNNFVKKINHFQQK